MIPASPDDETSTRVDNHPLERRSALEIRAVGDRIVGHALVFDSRSRDLGGFVEVVRSQAVDRSLASDIVALYNHDAGAVLGRTPKTLSLRKDDRGLAFDLTPPDTQIGRDTLTLVRRGDLTGASFGFHTVKDRWSTVSGVTLRELLDVEIVEISVTAIPVYQETDVAIAQRGLQAWQQHVRTGQSVRWLRMKAQR